MQYFGLNEPIAKRNPSDRSGKKRDYREFYNDKTIQIIADWYADDINAFGFDFDTSATKGTYFTQ
jgi:hypothetical protein